MSTEDRIENVNPEVEAEEVSEEVLSEQRQIRREKLKTLQDEEAFIVDAIEEIFLENGIQCDRKNIVSDLALKYVSGFGSINTNVEFDAFDVLIELIYNIKQNMA